MELNQTGESIPTNPATITPDSGLLAQEQPAATPKTPDEAFADIMDSASARMAGVPPKQPDTAPAPQDKPAGTAPDKPTEPMQTTPPVEPQKPETSPAPEAPRVVKLRVDGQEITVPEDRLVALAQQGVDYTQKSQRLADERKKMEAWQAVINRVQTDPSFAERFRGLFAEQQRPQAVQQQSPQETPPEDPVERFKWEIKREAVAEAREAILGQVKPVTEQQASIQHAVQLQSLKSELMRDPAYPEAMQLVRNYVANQPATFQERIYVELDQNPRAFLEVYGKARDHLMAMRQAATQQQAPAPVQPPATPASPAPQATPGTVERKVTPREAPQLESAGPGVAATPENAARAVRLKDLRKRVLSGNSKASDIGAYLDLTGAVGRMR